MRNGRDTDGVGTRTGALLAVALAALPLALPGCGFFSPTILVREASPARVYASLNTNVLEDEEPSTATREVLHAFSLAELAEDDPRAALQALHAETIADPRRESIFALAEFSFLIALDEDDPDAYLLSAVYAWHYLFGTEDPRPPSPYDRRFRWACDLYNAGVQRAFTTPDGEHFLPAERERTLPVGSLRVSLDRSHFPWTALQYPDFVIGDRFLIRGLGLRLRDSGLGVPLIGLPGAPGLGRTPVSAVLRVDGSLADMQHGVDGRLELHSVFDAQSMLVGDARIPLESDISVTLAHALHESPIWKFSLAGLFKGDKAVHENRLVTTRPHQSGRIPVVFVHGTASNPAYWADMFNSLMGDPELRGRMQAWFFQYSSGNPIVYSAATLRDALLQRVEALDPEGKDPALQNMVLIGHSQGGLIVKLVTVDGSMDWLDEILGKDVDELGFSSDQLAMLQHVFEFDPLPFVTRAVYVCTPHRGSFRADSWYANMLAKFIAVPGEVQGLASRLTSDARTKLPPELVGRIPTSLDNMNPSSPVLNILARTPSAPGVTCHSIIAIGDADRDDPQAVDEADDGVVQYPAAHIEPVASERLVNASHSCQDDPSVIREVRRILHEHLAALPPELQPAAAKAGTSSP